MCVRGSSIVVVQVGPRQLPEHHDKRLHTRRGINSTSACACITSVHDWFCTVLGKKPRRHYHLHAQ